MSGGKRTMQFSLVFKPRAWRVLLGILLALVFAAKPLWANDELNLPSEMPAENALEASETLREELARSLEGLVYEFDLFRALATLPGSEISAGQRALSYQRYIAGLHTYGLVPRDERACIGTLAPPVDAEIGALGEVPEVRAGEYRLLLTDPCYPVRGTPRLVGPRGWDPDGRPPRDDPNSGSRSIYRGGTETGGVGRGGRRGD